jgi:predicted AAA+ superfamily ATPase
MKRVYDSLLADHLKTNRQMAFVTGPRQVGKTTTCRQAGTIYLDWDSMDHSRLILSGPQAVAQFAGIDLLNKDQFPVMVFDELHKYPRWKNFLKGFFDLYEGRCRIVVTGSSRLDVYRRGGDSLMGRYFLLHMHPLSVAELIHQDLPAASIIRPPSPLDEATWETLWHFGGFPEPFISASDRFSQKWRSLRHSQLFREDARDLTRIQDIALLEIMGRLLNERSGDQLVIANLARDVGVTPNTAKAWVEALCALHAGFLIRPWHKNISSAVRKEPKWYLRDWSGIPDAGKKFETFIACQLLKAVEGWTDLGLGSFTLHYLRDKQKREVDFLVSRDGSPWFIVEAKVSDVAVSPALLHFQKQTQAKQAIQVVQNMPYVDADCFSREHPTVVPARTFLSQLL